MQSMMNAFLRNSQIVPVEADANARPDQGSAGASSSIVPISTVIPPVEHTFTTRGPPVYEGVPVAQRPTHQQVCCMTCSQALRLDERQVICFVCSSWIHAHCVEVLNIGETWRADMLFSMPARFDEAVESH